MASLQFVEGLIGTACAIACLYYARRGTLATEPQGSPQVSAPWHSALGEYARRNPFAAVFGALALGFLISSWSMYALPRTIPVAPPHAVEKPHTITRNVPVSDPAQAARITALQSTVSADAATIVAQKTEIDRLKQLLAKFTTRRGARSSTMAGSNTAPSEAKANPSAPEGTAATLNKSFNPASVATGAAAPASSSPSPTNQSPVTVPGNGTSTNVVSPAGASNTPTPDSTTVQPH
jgi:hypothetical protein